MNNNLIHFNNNIYNYIVPLGEECYTCQSIDSKFNANIRHIAYPFDYVGHTYIDKLTALIRIFINNKYILTQNDLNICLFGDKYYIVDKTYGFKYWHDICYDNIALFTDIDITNFIEKYNKRYNRLYTIIIEQNPILFISVNHFDNIYNKINNKNELLNLYEILFSLNNNIVLLAFNFDDTDYIYNNLHHICLDVNTNIPFIESKNAFQQKLYEYIKNNINTI